MLVLTNQHSLTPGRTDCLAPPFTRLLGRDLRDCVLGEIAPFAVTTDSSESPDPPAALAPDSGDVHSVPLAAN